MPKDENIGQTNIDPFVEVKQDFETVTTPLRAFDGKGWKLMSVNRDPQDSNYYIISTNIGTVRLHFSHAAKVRQLWLAGRRNFRIDVGRRYKTVDGQKTEIAPLVKVVPLD